MPRLFVAIDLPGHVKAALSGFAAELPVARWVGAEELHLTLRFIGEVDQESCSAIKSALSAISFSAFPLTLCGVGHFPPGRHPRVLWVGMEPCEGLMQLQQDVELALMEVGIAVDERPFSPHITLARLKETVPVAVTAFENRHAEFACPSFEVGELILYSSILTRQGAIHTREAIYRCR
ncbi:MAG: 2'-5' RNA ligase [Geobacteraceae bacterium GWC2_58_44]|nr:MAG: 2'-5' RNA ligase [Geobacteraceae bacterium GWC2_58_44]HBG08189.1 RNA 2',3'-cyclic phosphodiesterase [Geobacter sp.]